MRTIVLSIITTIISFTLMSFDMPKLPYATNALEPVISQQTIEFHYGKHLQNYVNTLNKLIEGTEYASKPLEEIVKTAPAGGIFNNAGQLLNHTLYFLQFKSPVENNKPTGKIAEAINRDFGSFEAFQKAFGDAAATLFGSGWAFLSVDQNGKLVITQEPNGANPVVHGYKPIFGLDVWEHAYYLDYQNRRADHIKAVWDIVDWDVVGSRL
jgi:superoxide dismutase